MSTHDERSALRAVRRRLNSLEKIVADSYIALRQGFEILNFSMTSPAASRVAQILDGAWNSQYLTATLRIYDLFSCEPTVNSVANFLGLVAQEAKSLSAGDEPRFSAIRARVEADLEKLATMRSGDAFFSIRKYRDKLGASMQIDAPSFPRDKGFTTRQARDLIEFAFDLLNGWREELGLPAQLGLSGPYGYDDTDTFFRLIELGADQIDSVTYAPGWRFGEQDWRGKFILDEQR